MVTSLAAAQTGLDTAGGRGHLERDGGGDAKPRASQPVNKDDERDADERNTTRTALAVCSKLARRYAGRAPMSAARTQAWACSTAASAPRHADDLSKSAMTSCRRWLPDQSAVRPPG